MNTKVREILKYKKEDYQMLILDQFVLWCGAHSYSNNHLQILVTSNALYNWFMREYSKREEHFLYVADPFIKKSHIGDLRKLHDEIVTKIQFFPRGILNKLFGDAKANEKRNPKISYFRPNYTLN